MLVLNCLRTNGWSTFAIFVPKVGLLWVQMFLTVWITKLFTVTMDELWSCFKSSTDLIPTISEDLRKAIAELKLSSAAELLSMSKNHWFSAKFLEAHCDSCVLSRTQKFFLKIFVYVWRSKNVFWNLAKSQLFFISCRLCVFWFLCCSYSAGIWILSFKVSNEPPRL